MEGNKIILIVSLLCVSLYFIVPFFSYLISLRYSKSEVGLLVAMLKEEAQRIFKEEPQFRGYNADADVYGSRITTIGRGDLHDYSKTDFHYVVDYRTEGSFNVVFDLLMNSFLTIKSYQNYKILRFLYIDSIKKAPTHINSKDSCWKVAALWRLKIGK